MIPDYSTMERQLIKLVETTYSTTGVNMSTELGDIQKTNGLWCYREDHARFQQVFETRYGITLDDGWVTRKTQVWELWDLIRD